jgi:hypothetical protein
MARIIYNVTSTYPPALTYHPLGGRQIVAGTITKVQVGKVTIPNNTRLPDHTSVDQLVWVKPEPTVVASVKPSTRVVIGSKGQKYFVSTLPSGRTTCTCPGFSFRKTCKHLGA